MTSIPIAEVPGTVNILHYWPGSEMKFLSFYINANEDVQGVYMFERLPGDIFWHDTLYLTWTQDIPYPHVGPLWHNYTSEQIFLASFPVLDFTHPSALHNKHWRAENWTNTLSMNFVHVPEPSNTIMWTGFAVCVVAFLIGRLWFSPKEQK